MLNRLKWIAVSYFTCAPTAAVIAIAAVLATFGVLSEPRLCRNDIAPKPPREGPGIWTMEDLDRVRRTHQQAEVRGIDLLQLFFAEKRLAAAETDDQITNWVSLLLDEFPNLQWVNVGILASLQDFATTQTRLEKLKQLESLSIDIVGVDRDLSWLRSLPKLRWLEVTSPVVEPNLAGLAALPRLETLTLMEIPPVTDRMLSQIVGIRGLKTLIVAPIPSPASSVQPPQPQFEILQRATNLKTLYYGQWRFGDGPNPVDAVQAALPGLAVHTAFVMSRCDPASQLASLICALLAGALSYQLATQFLGPSSRLIPGFGLPHALVATIWWGATVAVTGWFLVKIGFSILIALVLAAALTTLVAALGTFVLLSLFRTTPVNGPAAMLTPLWGLMVPGLLMSRPWWFEVYRGTTVLGCAASTAGLAVLLAWRLRPQIEMVSQVARPQGFFPREEASGWRGRLRNMQWFGRRREREIDGWVSQPAHWTWWRRIRRWRIGSLPTQMGQISFLATFLFTLGVMSSMGSGNSRFPSVRGLLAWGSAMALFQGLVMAIRIWCLRARTLPAESLRPGGNRGFRGELAAALAIDLAPSVLIFAVGEAIACNINSQNNIDWRGLPASLLVFLALGFSLVLSSTALCVVVRPKWLTIIVLAAAAGFSLFSVVHGVDVPAGSPLNPASIITPQAVQLQLWIPVIVFALLALIAAWRWRTMELADLG